MIAHAVMLLALLCGPSRPGAWDVCEEAQVSAATCQAAERHLRDGLRRGQTLQVLSCEPSP